MKSVKFKRAQWILKVENCIFWWLAKIKTDASLTRHLEARLQSVMVT